MSFSSNIFIVNVNKNKTYNNETLKTADVDEVNYYRLTYMLHGMPELI